MHTYSTPLVPLPVLRNALYQGDCRQLLRAVPTGAVDLVVTDPPYNIASAHALTRANGRVVTTAEAWGAWDQYEPRAFHALLSAVLTELHRVLRPGGQLYVWMGTQYLGAVLAIARQLDFRYRAKIVAVKARPQPSWRQQNFRSCYEECLYFSKGRPAPFHFTNQEAMGNVFMPPFEPKASAHPTEKRPAMLTPLIEASSNPGDLVLDPFLGSGSTAVVAASLGRHYLGFEQNARYLAMARARLQKNGKGP